MRPHASTFASILKKLLSCFPLPLCLHLHISFSESGARSLNSGYLNAKIREELINFQPNMNSDQLHTLLFNMKFASKQLEKSSKKAEKDAEKEKLQIKKALEKGNPEAAKIYAENAIRKRNESLNLLRLASRIDAAASRVDSAVKMQSVTKIMASTVKGMDKIMETMDPMKITAVMDQFENQVGTMDVNLGTMDAAFNNAQASTVPVSEVDNLLACIAEEHNIDTRTKIAGAQKAALDPVLAQQDKEMSDLLDRLKGTRIGA